MFITYNVLHVRRSSTAFIHSQPLPFRSLGGAGFGRNMSAAQAIPTCYSLGAVRSMEIDSNPRAVPKQCTSPETKQDFPPAMPEDDQKEWQCDKMFGQRTKRAQDTTKRLHCTTDKSHTRLEEWDFYLKSGLFSLKIQTSIRHLKYIGFGQARRMFEHERKRFLVEGGDACLPSLDSPSQAFQCGQHKSIGLHLCLAYGQSLCTRNGFNKPHSQLRGNPQSKLTGALMRIARPLLVQTKTK